MGNVDSQMNGDEYIQQQKEIIEKQQQQINNLMQQNQGQPINQGQQEKKESQKINPYKILGLAKQYNENELKKAYLQTAMVTHPDRGGSDLEFKKVQLSYQVLLKKLQQSKDSSDHNELRDNSKQYLSKQGETQVVNRDLSKNFNNVSFNKIFDQNRIENVYDNGYSTWMEENKVEDKDIENVFNGKYNEEKFNSHFDKAKKEQQQKLGDKLVKYSEPQVDISFKGKDSIMVLGQGDISDFSGESSGGLQYRDYRDAYSNTFLIHEETVDNKKRARSVREAELERKQTSYVMSEEDQRKVALKKKREEQEEQERIRRLSENDQKYFDAYDQVHQRMLGR
tara:strand:+ start:152 stop:1168 length:1017 start_codon:yes stop_codon:yes gene_type:complete